RRVLFRSQNRITSRRRREPRLAGRDGRFANQTFTLVKVGFLFIDMNNDPARAGSAFIIPQTHLSGAREGTLWKSLATANDQGDQACACNAEETTGVHEGGYLSPFS